MYFVRPQLALSSTPGLGGRAFCFFSLISSFKHSLYEHVGCIVLLFLMSCQNMNDVLHPVLSQGRGLPLPSRVSFDDWCRTLASRDQCVLHKSFVWWLQSLDLSSLLIIGQRVCPPFLLSSREKSHSPLPSRIAPDRSGYVRKSSS